MKIHGEHVRTITQDGPVVRLLDQNALPFEVRWHECASVDATCHAIRTMVVRGAGAIGATAAAGMAQAALLASDGDFQADIIAGAHAIRATRPTARNLFYGVEAVLHAIGQASTPAQAREAALHAAQAVADDDADCCRAIGEHGAVLLHDGMTVSTHCNAGWLAFVDWGSALSPVYTAHRAGRRVEVWVDETRPRGQGARLTAFELGQEGVPHRVACDGAIAQAMRAGRIHAVIVGSDRIAANGDVANKIGTYLVALAARAHGIPFYVAAPTTTIDAATPTGDGIEIEERDAEELSHTWGWSDQGTWARVRTLAPGSAVANPAFDVTPAGLVAGIITEKGIVPATTAGIASVARVGW